jgi:hypothetical protein
MANGYVPPNAAEIVENPHTRKVIYKVVGYVGLLGTVVTVGIAPFGLDTGVYAPYLLSFWAVFGAVQKWSSFVADKNVIEPPKV